MLGLQAKTLARVGARKGCREASPTTCYLRVKNLMFYIIKFSHLKSNRLAGGTRPAHATPRSAPARVPPIGSCPAAPPSRGCALARPGLRPSNMAASASVRGLGRRVSGQRMGGREGWGRRPVSAHSRSLRRCWRAAGSCLAPGAPCTPPRCAPR